MAEPNEIANLTGWWNPNDEAYANGANFAAFQDQSGQGHTLTASGTVGTMLLVGINGEPVLNKVANSNAFVATSPPTPAAFTYSFTDQQITDALSSIIRGDDGFELNLHRDTAVHYIQVKKGGTYNCLFSRIVSAAAAANYTVVASASECRCYCNGELMVVYGTQTLGSTTFEFKYFFGISDYTAKIGESFLYDRALSDAEVKSLKSYTNVKYGLTPKSALIAAGNSLVASGMLTVDPTSVLGDTLEVFNTGVAGRTIPQMIAAYATEVLPLYSSGRPFNFLFANEFVNSINGGITWPDAFSGYMGYLATAEGDGFVGVAVTPPPWATANEVSWLANNADIVSDYATYCTGYIDPAALAPFSSVAATSDPLYFLDGTHITDLSDGIISAEVTEWIQNYQSSVGNWTVTTLNATTLTVG